jgi:phospholipase/lecithinase/hemolysin
MNTETLNALKLVNLQINALQSVLSDTSLSPALTLQENNLIQQAINDQMDLQDTLIHLTLQAMVDQINATNADLQGLIKRMQQAGDRLAKLAAGIKKVSDVVGVLADITAQALAAGLVG